MVEFEYLDTLDVMRYFIDSHARTKYFQAVDFSVFGFFPMGYANFLMLMRDNEAAYGI